MSGEGRDTDLDIPPALDRRGKRDSDDGYDGQDDAKRSHDEAVRAQRLEGIREGKYQPSLSDPEEMAAAAERKQKEGNGTMRCDEVRFVKELYPRLKPMDDVMFHFVDRQACIVWEVFPDDGGWGVKKSDLQTLTLSQTHGGLTAAAANAVLRDWGIPVDVTWTECPVLIEPAKESRVYVIGCDVSRLVKIGRSDDIVRRLDDIQRMSPVSLTILHSAPGDATLEAHLHRVFAGQRHHGEWFDFGDADPVALVRDEIEK